MYFHRSRVPSNSAIPGSCDLWPRTPGSVQALSPQSARSAFSTGQSLDLSLPRSEKLRAPKKAEFRTQCAEICRSTWDASGYYGGRFEAVAFFPRKPLIWKREEILALEARSAGRIAP